MENEVQDIEDYNVTLETAAMEDAADAYANPVGAQDDENDEQNQDTNPEPEEQPDPMAELRATIAVQNDKINNLQSLLNETTARIPSTAPVTLELKRLRQEFGDELADALLEDIAGKIIAQDYAKQIQSVKDDLDQRLQKSHEQRELRLLSRLRPQWQKVISPDNERFVKFIEQLPKDDYERYFYPDANADDAVELIDRFEEAEKQKAAKQNRLESNIPAGGRGSRQYNPIDEEAAMEEGARRVGRY